MKGVFSSAEELLERRIFDTFPRTLHTEWNPEEIRIYSGSDVPAVSGFPPQVLSSFQQLYYLYGDMDMEEKLIWMDREYLSRFSVQKTDSAIRLQKPFKERVEKIIEYPVGEQEDVEENTYLTCSMVTGDGLDVEKGIAFQVLEYALLDAPGAPLKQALLDAGLGKDVIGSYEDGIYQPFFTIMAKNARIEDKDRFAAVIEEQLRKLAEEGIDKKALKAGINYFEFRFREADYSSYPKGLMYGIDVMDSWLYDEDAPFAYLKQLDHYET